MACSGGGEAVPIGGPPGTILRYGAAAAADTLDPPPFPFVRGDSGQISIFDGYFRAPGCTVQLARTVEVSHDTVTVRFRAVLDTLAPEPCTGPERPLSYTMLVGQFTPGDLSVRVIHANEARRDQPLDTVFDIEILPQRRGGARR